MLLVRMKGCEIAKFKRLQSLLSSAIKCVVINRHARRLFKSYSTSLGHIGRQYSFHTPAASRVRLIEE